VGNYSIERRFLSALPDLPRGASFQQLVAGVFYHADGDCSHGRIVGAAAFERGAGLVADLHANVVLAVGAAPVGAARAVHADRRRSDGRGQVHRAGIRTDEQCRPPAERTEFLHRCRRGQESVAIAGGDDHFRER
jgi:hypothetical protein